MGPMNNYPDAEIPTWETCTSPVSWTSLIICHPQDRNHFNLTRY